MHTSLHTKQQNAAIWLISWTFETKMTDINKECP